MSPSSSGRGRVVAAVGVLIALIGALVAPAAAAAGAAGDGPAGFYFATDSTGVPIAPSGPVQTPAVGGAYGGYMGMAGDWAHSAGCGSYPQAWSAQDAAAAHRNHVAYHTGAGAGAYWFMGGPGVDPHYNGSTAEAASWGRLQAAWALASIRRLSLDQPVLWMDIELPGSTVFDPVADNGWLDVYRSACDAQPTGAHVTPALARAELDGFAGYLAANSALAAGVYSDAAMWATIFGTGADARVTNLYEWTANGQASSLQPLPRGWCRSETTDCAQFFGGITASSPYAVAWQWSGGGGARNGIGDFDTVDTPRLAAASPAGARPVGEPTTVALTATATGYLVVSSAGNVFDFHTAFHGSEAGRRLPAPVVASAVDPATGGYWLVTSAGNVYDFGAPWYGSLAGRRPGAPVTGIAATATGYLLTTTRGNVYNFHTPWHGSEAGATLPAPVVGIAADTSTGGYWLATSGGEVYNFHAPWYGSARDRSLAPVVGIAPTKSGYVLATAAGNVFGYDTAFHGSATALRLPSPIAGIGAQAGGGGYWLVTQDGDVIALGAPYEGRAHTAPVSG